MDTSKRTVVIGASSNAERYSYMATNALVDKGFEVFPIGIKAGEINKHSIITDRPLLDNIDTVTLYIGPDKQEAWKAYIYALHPKRIIFNPGTENTSFKNEAISKGIDATEACTLVLLSTKQY